MKVETQQHVFDQVTDKEPCFTTCMLKLRDNFPDFISAHSVLRTL